MEDMIGSFGRQCAVDHQAEAWAGYDEVVNEQPVAEQAGALERGTILSGLGPRAHHQQLGAPATNNDTTPGQVGAAVVGTAAGLAIVTLGVVAGVGALVGAGVAAGMAKPGQKPAYGKGAAIGAGGILAAGILASALKGG
jgi:hypothetical protein